MRRDPRIRADAVAGWAVGVGVGLIAMMLTWLIGARVAAVAWEPPTGPTVALVAALAVGAVVSVATGSRLGRRNRGSVDG